MKKRLVLILMLLVMGSLLLYCRRSRPVCTGRTFFTPLTNETDPAEAYPVASLGPKDHSTLINIDDFTYTMLPPINECDGRQPLLLVLISTAPQNTKKRDIIRSTWLANQVDGVVHLFLLGRTLNETLEQQLSEENDLYGDIVQGKFVDAYRNMTYKHTMGLKWAVYSCPEARYIARVDDDIGVNVTLLLKFLRGISPYGARDLLVCPLFGSPMVLRTYRTKWRVSYSEYPDYKYPDFCVGGAVVYSPDVVFRLYREVQRLPYFWIDDVHVTGVAAREASVRHSCFQPKTNPFKLND